jgi:flagellin-like hook-associated protein FlgL
MRSNLLSLQNTVNLLDRTQSRLSSGKKVNTAIDNPVSFFAAQSLTSRASIIDSLKDAMGQAVQTITAADKGITSISAMIEQAKGIAQAALSAAPGVAADPVSVAVTTVHAQTFGTVSIDVTGMTQAQTATVTFELAGTLTAGESTVVIGGNTFTLTDAGEPGEGEFADAAGLAALINDIEGYTATEEDGVITVVHTGIVAADITGDGAAEQTLVNADVAGDTITVDGTTYTAGADFTTAAGLVTILEDAGYTASAALNVISVSMEDATVAVADFTVSAGIEVAEDAEPEAATQIAYGGVTYTAIASGTPTATQFLVGANQKAAADNLAAAILATANTTNNIATVTANAEGSSISVTFNAAPSAELTSLTAQYNTLLTQLTELAEDSGYKGKNLLSADILVVKFEGTDLSVAGFDASAGGLGVDEATWTTGNAETKINASLTALDGALTTLRSESSKLSGNLSIITVRQDFSTNMINTLTQGADKLTLADANEEGANMLMLQTRQSLSTTALSMSAQAAQSVLRLFQ